MARLSSDKLQLLKKAFAEDGSAGEPPKRSCVTYPTAKRWYNITAIEQTCGGRFMTHTILVRFLAVMTLAVEILQTSAATGAQQAIVVEAPSLDRPLIFDSSTRGPGGTNIPGPKFRLVPLRGLATPYALAFLPDGSILITERVGRLRIIRDGNLDPRPIAGIPEVLNTWQRGMNDIALHPRFAENRWLYFTYYKPVEGSPLNARATLARARFDGGYTVSDVREIFSTDAVVGGPSAAHIVFGRDDKIYMAIGIPIPRPPKDTVAATVSDAQDPNSYYGKVLRLNDDGSVPKDNPFYGRSGHKPELYALGIRNAMGLYVHPETGELWETENGPQGGDEINGRARRRHRSYFGSAIRSRYGTAVALLVSLDRTCGDHVLYREPVPRLEGQHLYRWAGRYSATTHRPESDKWTANPSATASHRTQTANPGGEARSRRAVVSTD